ncbi:hypothetical protein GGP41_004997 [Bipolaris sorokiniana]|uniref:Uncharacterized protein n=1 Tax=Cochliobolus sativus TaxID=45130 RepID=A0A8H6DVM3_COCSA|nr:hypothetical protein GGP41_004997 [Bipolaris sorokiniana]
MAAHPPHPFTPDGHDSPTPTLPRPNGIHQRSFDSANPSHGASSGARWPITRPQGTLRDRHKALLPLVRALALGLFLTSGHDPTVTASPPLPSWLLHERKETNAASITVPGIGYVQVRTASDRLRLSPPLCPSPPSAGSPLLDTLVTRYPEMPAVASSPDKAVSWTPTLVVALENVPGQVRRLQHLSTCATWLLDQTSIHH